MAAKKRPKKRVSRADGKPSFTTTGEYSDRVLDDPADTRIYFAPPGGKIPNRRSDYVLGTLVVVVVVVVGGLGVAAGIIAALFFGEFAGRKYLLTVPLVFLLVFALVAPFLRRRRSAEGRFIDGLARGDFVAVTRTPMATRLAKAAGRDQPGYYEQAEELARAEALRTQAEQMEELSGAATVTGADAERMRNELDDYSQRLTAAAAYRQGLVTNYLGGAGRG